jgi:Family of unknown function (DUF5994)
MASAPRISTVSLEERPRLRMKPVASPSGVVDGAWWPRSRDLADQLPDLLIELWDRLGGVVRVSYNLTAWPGAPRRMSVAGQLVRLGGYRRQDPLTIDLVSGRGGRITTLLVVPVEASDDEAEAALAAGSDPGRVGNIRSILESAGPSPRSGSEVSA